MLDYWGNPDNEFISRTDMYRSILKIRRQTFYKHFTPVELSKIEHDALELRKQNSSRDRAEVYKALTEQAKAGKVRAIKEFLDRIEGKVIDRQKIDFGEDTIKNALLSIDRMRQGKS